MAAIIDYIPRVTLSNFKELIKQQSETKETLFIRFTLKDIQYTVVMSVEKQKLIFFGNIKGKGTKKRSSSRPNQAILETGLCGTFFVLIPVINAANFFLDGKTIASRYALAIFTVIQKESRSGRFFYGFGRLEYQYEDTGNSSNRRKNNPYGIKSGRIIRNWKNTISCWMNTFYQDQEDENH